MPGADSFPFRKSYDQVQPRLPYNVHFSSLQLCCYASSIMPSVQNTLRRPAPFWTARRFGHVPSDGSSEYGCRRQVLCEVYQICPMSMECPETNAAGNPVIARRWICNIETRQPMLRGGGAVHRAVPGRALPQRKLFRAAPTARRVSDARPTLHIRAMHCDAARQPGPGKH